MFNRTVSILLLLVLLAQTGHGADPSVLQITPWADESLIGSPVSIDFDDQGRAYVTQSRRRKVADLDIRAHVDWMIDDIGFRTVEDKRQHFHQKMAPARSDQNKKWLKDLNGDGSHDWRDLTAISEVVYRLEDSNADGAADRATVFAEGFDTEVTGVAAGVWHHDGKVYMTCAPDMWELVDEDGDGKADRRRSLVHGFGVHVGFGGHDMHGAIIGPDGRLYWSIGDKGVGVIMPDGKPWPYPNEGAMLRCELDGSGFEVYARGLRNPQEIDFDDFGNWFSVDNDGDFNGERERLVYITEGSDTGWRLNWQYAQRMPEYKGRYNVWMEEGLFRERFDGQAAYITPTLKNYSKGPCGFRANPGTALNPDYRGYFFLTQFPGKVISAFRLAPRGAGFEMTDEHTVYEGVLATGLAFGPDGALYTTDWIDGWDVHDKGRVWKIDDPKHAASEIRTEVRGLLKRGTRDIALDLLKSRLSHADRRVRLGAQFELVRRGEPGRDALLESALQTEHRLARVHGIWGIGQFARRTPEAITPLLPLLLNDQEDPEILVQIARIAADARHGEAAPAMRHLMRHAEPRVQFAAALAAGTLKDSEAFDPAVAMLVQNQDRDVFVRHAGVMALTGTGRVDRLTALHTHPSLGVRLAAVVALRRLGSPHIAVYLNDADEKVVAETARAIHDDLSIPEALPALAQLLERDGLTNEPALRRAINANLRLSDPQHVHALGTYARRENAPAAMRAMAILSLSEWPNPPRLDRVEGVYREPELRDRSHAQIALRSCFDAALSGPVDVQRTAVQAAAALQDTDAIDAIAPLAMHSEKDATVRVAAIAALGSLRAPQLSDVVATVLKDKDPRVRAEAQRWLGGAAATTELSRVLKEGTPAERQGAFATLATLKSKEADKLLDQQLDKLAAGRLDASLQLDLIEAIDARADKNLDKKLEAWRKNLPTTPPVEAWRMVLQGGDADRGHDVLLNHAAAQCVRCHSLDGQPGVGPDLKAVGSRLSREQLIESLIDPNAQIAPGFELAIVTLKDGRVLSGSLRETDGKIIVTPIGGKPETALATEIAAKQILKNSMMPPMGAILSKREIRDLIAYLSTLK